MLGDPQGKKSGEKASDSMKDTRSKTSRDSRRPIGEVEWVLLDTETTGFAAPVFVVELAAQRMRGWNPAREPFRKLLNHKIGRAHV